MKWNVILRRVLAFLVLTTFILPITTPRGADAAEMLRNIVVEKTKNLFPPTEKGYRFRCPVFGKCNHRIVGMFMTERRGVPEAWVLAAVPNESDCHGCMSRLTLEVYRKQQGKWEKYRVWRDFDEAGSWGVGESGIGAHGQDRRPTHGALHRRWLHQHGPDHGIYECLCHR